MDTDTSVEREDNARNQRRLANSHRRPEYVHSEFTIKDIEGSLTYFTGDEKWIIEFEDASDLLQWSELQKLI